MKMSVGQFLGLLVVIAVIVVAAVFGATKLKPNSSKARQAVFLTNGQVYFGYLSNTNDNWIVLKDIYYLQVQQPLQPADKNAQPQVSLVKLGNELHGPVDVMQIARSQVLFYEDMKSDSKVNQAIDQFIKSGGPTASPSPAATK